CAALSSELRAHGWITYAATAAKADLPFLDHFDHIVAATPAAPISQAQSIQRQVARGIDLLVVDHYGLDARFETAARAYCAEVLVIDDLVDRQHDCDWLLNPGLEHQACDYADLIPPHCIALLGPQYVPLREEFAELRRKASNTIRSGTIPQVIVSLGASDPTGLTQQVLEGVANCPRSVNVDVLTTSTNPRIDNLRGLKGPRGVSHVTLAIDPSNVGERLLRADFAIGAGGVSTWERCCLGVPSILVEVAANQRANIRSTVRLGAGWAVGTPLPEAIADLLDHLASHPVEIETASRRALRICDGLGARRTRLATVDVRRSAHGDTVWLRAPDHTDGCVQTKPNADGALDEWKEPPKTTQHTISHSVMVGRQLAGWVHLESVRNETTPRRYHVSIWITPSHRRQGIARLALGLAHQFSEWAELASSPAVGPPGEQNPWHALFTGAGYACYATSYRVLPLRRQQ
ncbi:MAG: UDP-2,4-diacetamido-2,4,6-trideoxy-beta-L-altropyranose hydrolase, partial [Chromatiales bacterium]|nr:UDP-2,4-diacetamido-2,4,6-trideoxy-beta-L-altropyranose hydrolase [Chromatiales bacterium]